MSGPAPWRVVLVTQIAEVATGYALLTQALGHEPVALLATRRRRPQDEPSPASRGLFEALVWESPPELPLLVPATRGQIAPLLRAYEPDLVLCTGFPWRVPADALAVPRLGWVNGHPSLLPRYRGPSPIAWAVREGEREIGLSYHRMDEHLDTGPLLAQATIPLDDDETMATLNPKLARASAQLLPQVFARLAAGDPGDPQPEGGDYRSVFEPEYARVDPAATAAEVHRQVRAWAFTGGGLGIAGPLLERDGRSLRLLETSLVEVPGAERLECVDGPLWVVAGAAG